MSRYTGLYTGFKLCNEILEQTMTVDVRSGDNGPVLPDRGPAPAQGFHHYPTHLDRQQFEIVAKHYRRPLVEKFVRANMIDRGLIDDPAGKPIGSVWWGEKRVQA